MSRADPNPSRPEHALMLAAGVGARMEGLNDAPKVLLAFAGRTLLERHVRALEATGIRRLTLAVGYRASQIESALAAMSTPLEVSTVHNPRFREGGVVSLATLLEAVEIDGPVLLMDADVLYHPEILHRLTRPEGAPSRFLLDRDFEPGDEPVKLCLRDGVPVEFRKHPDPDIRYDLVGESVGFFRFSKAAALELRDRARSYLERGRTDEPYEEAVRDLVRGDPTHLGVEDVTGILWIELDFPADVRRAAREVLPRLPEVSG